MGNGDEEMDESFVPVPDWLELSKKVKKPYKLFPMPNSLEFLLECFSVLYSLGMTNRQVVELTALFIILSEHQRFNVPLTEQRARTMSSPEWFLADSKFFQVFRTLEEQIRAWVDEYLSKANLSVVCQQFWSETGEWVKFFLKTEEELKQFERIIEATKIRFVQHCLKVPITGTWDDASIVACKKFQAHLPKVVLPWKKGVLNGFTYKVLAQTWRRNLKTKTPTS
jgi:hypothetical protein